MNLLDRAISVISPQSGLKRIQARSQIKIMNSGYGNHGANLAKKSMLGWIFKGGSPEEDISKNLETLRQRSRDLYMGGAPIATGAIKTLRTNVVGSGLRPKPQLDPDVLGLTFEETEQLERQIEREFELWSESKNCDAQRMNNFYELQQLVFLSQLLSGEVFIVLPYIDGRGPYELTLQVIEADRVDTPSALSETDKDIRYGIEYGKYGEAVAYYFLKNHPLSQDNWKTYLEEDTYDKVPAFDKKNEYPNVLHVMESERPGQNRGVPVLAPCIESLKQLGRYTDAELMAAVVSAMYSIFIVSDVEAANDDLNFGEGSIPDIDQVDAVDPHTYELGAGSIMELAPGEKIQEANPGRPNTAFDSFVEALSRQIGAALEIPSELLMKQFNSSYSASRAALLEAWKMFKMRRAWLASDFCQPVYEQFFAEAVAKDRIKAPGFFEDPLIRKAYTSCEWSGPTQGQLDPLKEVVAAEKRVQAGFSTRARETIELMGGDYTTNARQRVQEEELMRKVRKVEEEDDADKN